MVLFYTISVGPKVRWMLRFNWTEYDTNLRFSTGLKIAWLSVTFDIAPDIAPRGHRQDTYIYIFYNSYINFYDLIGKFICIYGFSIAKNVPSFWK